MSGAGSHAAPRAETAAASRRPAAIAVALLVLAAIVVAVGAAELGARLVDRARCVERLGGVQVRDPRFGWGNRPGATGWLQGCLRGAPEWRTWIRIDSEGLRGDEIAPEPSPGTQRILLLGDSFVFGAQVDEEAQVASRLAAELGRRRPDQRFEILNGGVDGWGTDNAVLFFEQVGWRYRPDLVLLFFDTTNDIFENSRRLVSTSSFWPDKPYFALEDGGLVLRHFPLPPERPGVATLRGLGGALVRHSTLARLATRVSYGSLLITLPAPPPAPDAVPAVPLEVLLRDYPPHWDEAWRITDALVGRARDVVERQGARFGVVVVDAREEVSPARLTWARAVFPSLGAAPCDPDKPNRMIGDILARRRIAAIPLLDAFRGRFAADGTPGFFQYDIHWAPAGHALAAAVIADGIERHGLLPEARPAPPAHGGA